MVLKKITYSINGKKYSIEAEIVNTPWGKFKGLMLKKDSPPLLFIFNKEKNLSIHSFFCKPFKAIWLDKNMGSTKIIDSKSWKIGYKGKGKFILEIPTTTLK
jgi:uncharacterized membrane protein (UPF0127 family)|tara:strand:- start:433 stop:738 length:306 start_codon:yes stop_codon:yes gene_type:complete